MAFLRRHPVFTCTLFLLLVSFLAADVWLVTRRARYEREIERLRAGMTTFERDRADAILTADRKRLAMMVELVRQQARGDQDLHLAVALDSGTMSLRRAGAVLREVEIEIGGARRVGEPPDTLHLAVPLGKGAVQRVLDGRESWEVPAWVFADRGIRQPQQRIIRGALGPVAVVLEGGTVIYSMPSQGPLADSAYVLPGAIRARAADLQAIVANLRDGASVYFY